jgi:hypothetical protein
MSNNEFALDSTFISETQPRAYFGETIQWNVNTGETLVLDKETNEFKIDEDIEYDTNRIRIFHSGNLVEEITYENNIISFFQVQIFGNILTQTIDNHQKTMHNNFLPGLCMKNCVDSEKIAIEYFLQ